MGRKQMKGHSREYTVPGRLNFPRPVVATFHDPMGSFMDHRESTAVIFYCGQASCLSLPEQATTFLSPDFLLFHVCYKLRISLSKNILKAIRSVIIF